MEISLKENHSEYIIHVTLPDTCPRCGRDLAPKPLFLGHIPHNKSRINNAAVVICPHCNKPVYFDIDSPYSDKSFQQGTIIGCYPSIQIFDLPKGIEKLYPDFYKIYNQTAVSEAKGLSELCGMGYRKALEILVKQYALKTYPNSNEEINNEKLIQTINRIENPKIQALAKATAWLGNDQTHLQVKHPEYTVDDIKAFIKSLCYYILMEEEVARAQALVNKPNL